MRTIIPLTALLAFTIITATITAAHADEWCGFVDKTNARVRCGYSSLSECKQSLSDQKGAYCMPDPGFARLQTQIKVAARAVK